MPVTQSILPDWFQSDLGRGLLKAERDLFKGMIPEQYYQVGLQLGACDWALLDGLNVGLPLMLDSQSNADDPSCPIVLAEPEALPFSEHSIDLAIMPHGLDFCADPVATLREISQVLAPEGHLVLTGFNQTSLLGCCRFLNQLWPFSESKAPWNGRFYRVREIQEWLSLLGLETVGGSMLFYQLPLHNAQWRKRFNWMNLMGDRWWPGLGGVYVLVLKKRLYASSAKARSYRAKRNWLGVLNPAPVSNKNSSSRNSSAKNN